VVTGYVSPWSHFRGALHLIELKRKYSLEWLQYGSFWFVEVQGKAAVSGA
jgi:hypothetical protein